MEVDKSKCLICEVSCRQKGLAFFKFPKEELRLKMWIKEISPLLDILKIQPNSLKENGRICARHFRERDFINCKQDSLVHNACPSLSVSNLSLSSQKENISNEEGFSENKKYNNESEKDLFQCGRCKVQFEILPEFIDHKRLKCEPNNEKSIIRAAEIQESPSQNFLISLENSFPKNIEITKNFETDNCFPDQVQFKVIGQDHLPDNKIVSVVINENGLVVGTPVDVLPFALPVIFTSQLPLCYNGMVISNPIDLSLAGQVTVASQTQMDDSVFLNDIGIESQVNNLIVSDGTKSSKNAIYTCSTQKNSDFSVTSQVPSNHVVLTTELPKIMSDTSEASDKTFSYCKLVSAFNVSQTALFDLQEKKESKEVKRSSQAEEGVFEKSKTKLPCPYCGKVFEKPFNLQQHERVHTGERPFQCIVCGRAFSQKSNVRKHMMRHRVWPKGKQTLKLKTQGVENSIKELIDGTEYSCQYCTLSFKSYAEHKKHLGVHSNYKVYRCIQKGCSDTFNDLDEFLSHSKMHSSAEFQCHICLKSFTHLEELGVHQYDHDTTEKKKQKENEIKLKCKVCHARFKTAESLKNHLAVDNHNYECIYCKSVFCSERFLRRHLFIHMDSSFSKFKCQNCKKSFRTQQNLKNHLFIHLKEKPFTCDHCDKQFASKYRLKRHMAIHLNQYLECPFKKHLGCDKTFYRKDKLRDHVNTHSHCKMRSCRICSKMYWTLSKLHQHMKRDHKTSQSRGEEELKCFTCFQTFRKSKQLSLHHCTVEKRKSINSGKNTGAREREKNLKTVSNIEIIMVPFDANGENLT